MTALQLRAVEEAGTFERLCALLEMVDEAHAGESGSIVFGGGSKGIILVQSGRICWAASPAIATRLSHRLRRDAPIDDRQLADVFRECRENGTPFGQALVARGLVTFDALRAALREHTAETLTHLADEPSPRWVPGPVDQYDRGLTFSSAELLTHAADGWWGPLASEARNELAAALGGRGATGLAFLCSTGTLACSTGTLACETHRQECLCYIIPVGVAGAAELTAKEVLAAGRAAAALMRAGEPLGGRLVANTSADGRTSITWLDHGAYYVAIAAERSEIAYIVAHVSRRSG